MGLRLQHEDGTAISELGAGGDELFRVLPWRDAIDYPYLRYVEPYGDTYFNSLQMSAVLPELRRLAEANDSPVLRQVVEMAELCEANYRWHLVFLGD
jgi:hypothetical protein